MKIQFTNFLDVDIEKPIPASKVLPDWYKDMASYFNEKKDPTEIGRGLSTSKKCMPMLDALSAGYLILSAADVYVKPVDGQPYFTWSNFNLINFHETYQLPSHPQNKYNNKSIPKWNNYWGIKTPKGYSTLFTQPVGRDLPFTIVTGLVDTDKYNYPIQFPFFINEPNFEGLIPAGTPIAQVIPIKRDSWNTIIGNEKDIRIGKSQMAKAFSKFFNGYKTFYWTKKEYK